MVNFFLQNDKIKIITIIFLALLVLLSLPDFLYASSQEASTAPPVCGNNIKETGEECDGDDLDETSCVSLGYCGGILSCNSDCTFNVSDCTTDSPSAGGGSYIPPTTSIPKPVKPKLSTGDFNDDGFIDYRDLSILLYWFGKTGPEIIPYDLNGDKKINFVDISILLYRWKD